MDFNPQGIGAGAVPGSIPIATNAQQMAFLMAEVAEGNARVLGDAHDLVNLCMTAQYNDKVVGDLTMGRVMVEEQGMTDAVLKQLNGHGELTGLLVGTGATTTPRTQAERETLARFATEAFGEKLKAAGRAVIDWFKKIWEKIKAFFAGMFNQQKRFQAALKSQQERIKKLTTPMVEADAKMSGIAASKFSSIVASLGPVISKLGTSGSAMEAASAAMSTTTFNEKLGTESGTVGNMGWGSVATIVKALEDADKVVEKLNALKGAKNMAEKMAKEGLALAEQQLKLASKQGVGDKESIATKLEAAKKGLTVLSSSLSNVITAVVRIYSTAMAAARKVKETPKK